MTTKKKDEKKTDRWYLNKPEWGTPEATKKAQDITPGEPGDTNEENIQEISTDLKKRYLKKATKDRNKSKWDVAAHYDAVDNSMNWGYPRDANVHTAYAKKAANRLDKREKGIKRARKSMGEEVAANNTGAFPSPAETAQGDKKKKYRVLTRHYIELLGKRRKRVT